MSSQPIALDPARSTESTNGIPPATKYFPLPSRKSSFSESESYQLYIYTANFPSASFSLEKINTYTNVLS